MAMEHPMVAPPPPPPAPPPPQPSAVPHKKKLYQAIAEGKAAVEGDHEEARILLAQRERRKDLQWLLFNKYVPSLIQNGPQCGLVALWMATHLLHPAKRVSMETVVQTALDRGYTAQGEMFSAQDMAVLAEEVCGCKAVRLSGGIEGHNTVFIMKHLTTGQPVLIPYDEDFNHAPCQRNGHKAHWAVASGVLLGLAPGSVDTEQLHPDSALPWLNFLADGAPCSWPVGAVQEVYILAKQGKSLRYQLWKLDAVSQSNAQLREMAPLRAGDGTHYVLPEGGVGKGLAGQVVLLHTNTQAQ
ncbi:actin maturation protease isoform X2 [Chanos chanos]|uniref:Actin maturation protease n=1 Tax=Chanos chanos TaxID=29144 RepID=A0A6J2URI8_CHACN|nr:UPF0692 protein C19orf54 homolog isoform X2 [Chanos chanos]